MSQRQPIRVALLATALASLGPGRAHAELAAVWAVDDGTKVKAAELAHPLKANNGIFAATKPAVRLFGMRNETVAFQLILQGGKQATAKVRPRLEAVGPIRNGELSTDPDRYFIGRRIELFAEQYLKIKEPSRGSIAWASWTAAQPKGIEGAMLPDALVPLRAGKDHVTVAAGRNQGIWVDIYIPKDTAPGNHRGQLVVEVDGKPCALPACKLAVELEVLGQTMPDKVTTKTMLYFSGGDDDRDGLVARYYNKPWDATPAQMDALRARHYKLLRRHRISGIVGHDKQPGPALKARLDGSAFSRAAGYEGPGEGVGQDVYSIHTYGNVKLDAAKARAWSEWFVKHAPDATRFYYVIDEPGRDDYPKANRRALAVKPHLLTFITTAFTPSLKADIFCALTDHYSVAGAERAKQAKRQQWIYNGTRPFSGSFMTDDVAVATRVNPWIQHKHKIPRWFYWESTYYRDFQGGRKNIDVYKEANNFRNSHGDRLNGDGLLLYPGRDRVFAAADRGLDVPLPSIRLKNWRRGIEDVEYLEAATKAGHKAFVDKLVKALVPRALADELEANEPVPWPEDGEKWLEARRKLFELLRTGKPPALDTEALAAPAEPTLRKLKRKAIATARQIGKPTLFAIAGFVGLVFFTVVGWLWARRRARRRERTFE